jgi:hypothetical protein
MPAAQKEIAEKYGTCLNSLGKVYTDYYGERLLFGRVLHLQQVERCVDAGDPQKGNTTGSTFKMVLGSALTSSRDLVKTQTTTTQRVYAFKVAPDGTEMRAAYDLVASHLPDGTAPDYPERYARLDLACGDATAFPEFDGWTGRITVSASTTDTSDIYYYVLVGSAKDGSGDRAFHFRSEVPL